MLWGAYFKIAIKYLPTRKASLARLDCFFAICTRLWTSTVRHPPTKFHSCISLHYPPLRPCWRIIPSDCCIALAPPVPAPLRDKSPGRVTDDALVCLQPSLLLPPILIALPFAIPIAREPPNESEANERSTCQRFAHSSPYPTLPFPPPEQKPLPSCCAARAYSALRQTKQTPRRCTGAAALHGSSRPPTMKSFILAASPASPIASAVPLDLHI